MPLRNKSHLPAGVDGQMGVCVEICVRLASSSAISAFLGAAPGDPAGSRPCAAECPRFELDALRGNASDRSRSGTVRWLSAHARQRESAGGARYPDRPVPCRPTTTGTSSGCARYACPSSQGKSEVGNAEHGPSPRQAMELTLCELGTERVLAHIW